MHKTNNKKLIVALASISLMLCVLLASVLTLFVPQKNTDALTASTIKSATRLGGDDKSLWNESIGKFDGDVIEELTDKVFGSNDSV
ncbi:MAG: hypothetical protein K2L53_05605, partial [Clostridia bacterium]|nr:hypothetical protein [Clostridia bacterium]